MGRIDRMMEFKRVMLNVLLDIKKVISRTFFSPISWLVWRK